jgi:DnaJ-class molecular chaperone
MRIFLIILITLYIWSRDEFYTILGLKRNATEKDIKSSYWKLSKIYHPDVSDKADA